MIVPEQGMEGMSIMDADRQSVTVRVRTLASRATGEHRVWALSLLVAVLAGLVAWELGGLSAIESARTIPVGVLAGAFYLGEITVVHVKFKRNTQSFSMSEIPLVLGLFFLSPLALLGAQLLGNATALTLNRRQPPLKLMFNLA